MHTVFIVVLFALAKKPKQPKRVDKHSMACTYHGHVLSAMERNKVLTHAMALGNTV